ncbi:hypothetical protein EX30DRAFT_340112 [Ascodesmis nigricans]|uniref:Uncharacterized protein n=1 Tax=Ascodesmis nigricans TaxID=341454 RepID=A0A4S2MZQ6_9PEZI|nr:hypothetical protein EX30DRAFT_340112 [Ascodesmis nigricans]
MCIYKIRLYETCCHRGAPTDLELISTCPLNCTPVARSSTDLSFIPARCPDCKGRNPSLEPYLPPLRDYSSFSSTTGLHDDSGIVMPPTSSPFRNDDFNDAHNAHRFRAQPYSYAPQMVHDEPLPPMPDAPRKSRPYGRLNWAVDMGRNSGEMVTDDRGSPCPRRKLFSAAVSASEFGTPAHEVFERPPTPATPTPVRFKAVDGFDSPSGGKGFGVRASGRGALTGSCTPGNSPLRGKGSCMWK